MMTKVLFVDRDGTLIEEPADKQVDSLHKVRLLPGVIPELLRITDAGFRLVMVSNQDGLGTDAFPEADFKACQDHTLELFRSQGILFDEILICPHVANDHCECRKPRTGLLTSYLARTTLDTQQSAVIGDRDTDMDLAANIGIRGIRISDKPAESWQSARETLCAGERRASVERRTGETSISVTVDLDTTGSIIVDTGIGFYDHMLEQVAKHGGFSLNLQCEGDLEVDDHHTVEDTAIALGQALRNALDDKRGIERYGFLLPMDESEARASLDLCGRSSFRFSGAFPRAEIGGMSTEMIPHFFQSIVDSMAAALHIEVTGQNTHHMVEACFKSFGRCLRQAIARSGQDLPSTKGVLA